MKGGEKMKKNAFTLIELLIVIAILGILVALILPRFADIRTDANTKVCKANLRGLVSAMNTYETKENKPAGFNWTGMSVQDLVDWQYLATAPTCPEPTYSYTIQTTDGKPTATCSKGSPHEWPVP